MKRMTIRNNEKKYVDTPELKFFRGCPYFLSGKCASSNWGPESPCNKCLKEGQYNTKNANEVKVFVSLEGQKCR
ncbi:MAG: hypothetical protein K6F04_01810 [bacterium]|nr:hypothetical protein [bacterium]